MKALLQDILMRVSWGDISREYFGKSGSWIYHKQDGIDGNGDIDGFSPDEEDQPWVAAGIFSCMKKDYHLNRLMINWEARDLRYSK